MTRCSGAIRLEFFKLFPAFLFLALSTLAQQKPAAPSSTQVFGFRDFSQQRQWDQKFIAVPDPKQAEEHLRILTAEPHIAGSPEDHKTAEYVAKIFREAGLETEIVQYRVWMNLPAEISVEIKAPKVAHAHLPTPERVKDDPFQS